MSIHAQLSEEAQARLHAQKRNATLSSIILSILVIVLIFLVLGIFLLPAISKDSATIVAYSATTSDEQETQKKKVSQKIQTKPSPPSNQMSKVMAVNNSASPVSIPVPDVAVSVPSADFGSANEDLGGGWGGDGFGEGSGEFGGVPATMQKRCDPGEREKRLLEMGGTLAGEKAVIKALNYLKKTQADDGSWEKNHPVGMTGMALLAYLGHCETPDSKKYGRTVKKAITYLVDSALANNGYLMASPLDKPPAVYEHGIATYALAESLTFCKSLDIEIPNLEETVKRAVEIIIEGQGPSGEWYYNYRQPSDGDNSVGFWQIQALKAAKHTEIFRESKMKKHGRLSIEHLKSVQGKDGAIGYRTNSQVSPGLTGGGVLCMQLWGRGKSKGAKKGIKYIRDNTQFEWGASSSNLYYHYYNAQAMINAGGDDWEFYNDLFREKLIAAQESDGSWIQNMNHGARGRHMATCLATMMLEVYYRFLPGAGGE